MIRPNSKTSADALAGAMARMGVTEALAAWRRRRGDFRVFILDYHEVTAGPEEPEGSVSADRFRNHLQYLGERYDIVSLSRAVGLLTDGNSLDRDLLVITLDDGYVGNYEHAFDTLRRHNVPATVFVATGFIDGQPLWTNVARRTFADARHLELPEPLAGELERLAPAWKRGLADPVEALKRLAPHARDSFIDRVLDITGRPHDLARAMSWDQLAELSAAGMEIGCHTVNHPILPTLSPAEQREEIGRARDRIAEMIGIAPTVFAYPNGDYDQASIDAVRELGFTAACTTRRGFNLPGCDRFRLARIGIGADSNHLIAARLSGLLDHQLRMRHKKTGLMRSDMAHA